jgi:hypothetical protein
MCAESFSIDLTGTDVLSQLSFRHLSALVQNEISAGSFGSVLLAEIGPVGPASVLDLLPHDG